MKMAGTSAEKRKKNKMYSSNCVPVPMPSPKHEPSHWILPGSYKLLDIIILILQGPEALG